MQYICGSLDDLPPPDPYTMEDLGRLLDSYEDCIRRLRQAPEWEGISKRQARIVEWHLLEMTKVAERGRALYKICEGLLAEAPELAERLADECMGLLWSSLGVNETIEALHQSGLRDAVSEVKARVLSQQGKIASEAARERRMPAILSRQMIVQELVGKIPSHQRRPNDALKVAQSIVDEVNAALEGLGESRVSAPTIRRDIISLNKSETVRPFQPN
jgi:hypothetical protein